MNRSPSGDLDKFRKKWLQELTSTKPPQDCDDKCTPKPSDSTSQPQQQKGYENWSGVEEARKRPNKFPSFLLAEDLLKGGEPFSKRHKADNDTTLLKEAENPKPSSSNEFLDLLLKDLDEINEIPFFDIELPRELALKIFQYLGVKELCTCSQVSKAWKSLAEDELLWCWLSQNNGWDLDAVASEECNWKERVKDHYMKNMKVNTNWRMRTGLLHQLHYVRGGVLSCASSFGSQIVAGYSNNLIRYWNVLEAGEECTLEPSSSALMLNDSADEETIVNFPNHVTVNKNYTVAGYSQGIVDVWNKNSTKPSFSFRGPHCPQKVTWLGLSSQNTLAVAWGDHVFVAKIGDTQLPDSLDFHSKVNCACLGLDKEVLFVGVGDMLLAHTCGQPQSSINTLHHAYQQVVTGLDSRGLHVGAAIRDHSTLNSNYYVKLYSLEKGVEYSQLGDHLASITCLNLHSSPPNMCVTGSVDRKVRVCDERVGDIVMLLAGGHHDTVTCVQMDEWKVLSGGQDGYVCTWDQRMSHKLWDMYNRHPVKYVSFDENILVTASIPNNMFPESDDDKIPALRYRGNLELFDFSADQVTHGIPSICSSTFDEPIGYNYNIGLAVPYDSI